MRVFVTTCLLLVLSGCMTTVPTRPEPDYRPVRPSLAPPAPPTGGSLFVTANSLSLFDDRRAWQVGDVITIVLQESTRGSKSAETTLSKSSSTELANPTVLGNLVRGSTTDLFNQIENETDFEGEGQSDQSNSLTGTISVLVTEVYPNGLMQVEGEKWFRLNQGEEYVRVSGLIRWEDIDGGNTVSSQRIADARIAYGGTGALAQSNSAGWLTRFFMGDLFPF